MKTELNRTTKPIAPSNPVIFEPNFNSHQQTLNATQAWSLFFTGGKADNALGFEPTLGRVFTLITVAIPTASIVSSVFLTHNV